MRITFLGTAGGRMAVISQMRNSGGWILDMAGQRLAVDPGPGCLVWAKKYGASLQSLTGLVVSHCHPDHYTDAEYVIEAMTAGARKKKGVLVASGHVVKGGDSYRPAVSPYHLKALERVEILEPGKSAKIGGLKITGVESRHEEPKCLGFIFEGTEKIRSDLDQSDKVGRLKLGYVADSMYFEEQKSLYNGCDYLVVNCLRPRGNPWHDHMDPEGASELASAIKPKAIILTHFGIKMILAGPEKEARWVQDQTGVKVIAARDGMVFDAKAGKAGLRRFMK